jgi:hypothetical protein
MRVTDHQVVEGDGQQITLDLEAGLGSVRVETFDPDAQGIEHVDPDLQRELGY